MKYIFIHKNIIVKNQAPTLKKRKKSRLFIDTVTQAIFNQPRTQKRERKEIDEKIVIARLDTASMGTLNSKQISAK